MTVYRCDRKECGKETDGPLPVELRGYYPNKASGIMLPEQVRCFQFCSHDCFVKWMRQALLKED